MTQSEKLSKLSRTELLRLIDSQDKEIEILELLLTEQRTQNKFLHKHLKQVNNMVKGFLGLKKISNYEFA